MPLPRFLRRSSWESDADASATDSAGTGPGPAPDGEPGRDPVDPDRTDTGVTDPTANDDVEVPDEVTAEDETLLTTPLDDTDLNARLIAASGSGRARSTTVLLVIVVFVIGVVVGGAAGTSAVEIREAIAAQMGENEEVVPPPDALVDGRLHGTVRVVDGDTVLVDAPDGTTVRVEVTATTRVAATTPAELAELRPGTQLHVTGEASADGAVVATEVVDLGHG